MAYDAGRIEASLHLDRDPFSRGLKTARAQAAAFERDKIEPEIEVDRSELDRLRQQIDDLEASVDVDLDTTAARAQLAALEAQLDGLSDEQVNVRVREITTSIGALGDRSRETRRETDLLRRAMQGLVSAVLPAGLTMSRFAESGEKVREWANDTRVHLGLFSLSLSSMASVIGGAIPLVVSLGAALGALVASAAHATAGLGALSIAFGSLLAPAVVLGIGVVQRFKAQADKAGTAAHQLSQVAGRAGDAFRRMIAPGADAVLRGMADGLRSMLPTIRSLGPAFATFGRAVGDAFRTLGAEFASPQWRQFFDFLIRSAAQVTPILTRAFVGFARILRDIATAAMPSLIASLRSFADWLGRIAQSTSNVDALRTKIEGLVGHLKDWVNLAGQLGRVMLGFFRAAAPAGQELVRWLAEGARKLADWLDSTQGQAAVRQFFAAMIPMAKELVNIAGELGKAFLSWSQLIAPVLTPILSVLRQLLELLNTLLSALNSLPGPIKTVVGAFLLFKGPIAVVKLLWNALKLLGVGLARLAAGGAAAAAAGAMARLRGVFTTVATTIGTRVLPALGRALPMIARLAGPIGLVATAAVGAGLGLRKLAIDAGIAQGGWTEFMAAVPAITAAGVRSIEAAFTILHAKLYTFGVKAVSFFANGITNGKGKVSAAGKQVAAAGAAGAQALRGNYGSAGAMLIRALAGGESSQRGQVAAAGKGAGDAGRQGAQSTAGGHRQAGSLLGTNLAGGLGSMAGLVGAAARRLGDAGRGQVQGIAPAFQSAGAAIGAALANGIVSAIGAVAAAAARLAAAARSKLPGSEPKDHSSPLYGLKHAGRAVVDNFIAGFDPTVVAKAMQQTLSAPELAFAGRPGGPAPDPALAELRRRASAQGGSEPTQQINVYTLHPGDSRTLAAISAAANRGNSRRVRGGSSRTRLG